jgi:hypothetical protein
MIPMSPLATKIYKQLRKRVIAGTASITYRELAAALDQHPRSTRFHAALGEVANACRHAQLPCLPAIVWRADTRRPSTGYYKVAHPRAHTDTSRVWAWQREHVRVIGAAAQFPSTLDKNR